MQVSKVVDNYGRLISIVEVAMSNLTEIEKFWMPLCSETLLEIPTDHPLLCMVHKRTRERAYFDIKMDRLLSQQEAQDRLDGYVQIF